jgi:NADH-quinone oxidoreductase subunit L
MPLHHWLEPSLAKPIEHGELPHVLPWLLMALALIIAVLFWRLASNWFRAEFAVPRALELSAPRIARVLERRFWVDEIYGALIVRPLRGLAELCLEFDRRVVDGFFRALGQIAALLATLLRLLQSGVVHAYAFWFLAGAAFFLWLALR